MKTSKLSKRLFIPVGAFLLLLALTLTGNSTVAAAPVGKVFTVNNSTDDLPDANPGDGKCETAAGNGVCTLRAAIMEANGLAGADTVKLQAVTYTLTRVSSDEGKALDGDLDITDDLTLNGTGSVATIIDGNGNVTKDRVFEIYSPAVVNISGVTIRNGKVVSPHTGGGIVTSGTLTLANSIVSDNTSTGIVSNGPLTIINSTIRHNHAPGLDGDGGGINSNANSTLMLINSTVSSNDAGKAGGGILNFDGPGTIINSTVSGNISGKDGGGIENMFGTLTVINSTITGNKAANNGGGINNNIVASADLRNVTIAYNRADSDGNGTGHGGGVYIEPQEVVNIRNSIIALNDRNAFLAFDDCAGILNSGDYNLISVMKGCTVSGTSTHNKSGIPNFGALQNNGGVTETLALLTGSPAIDAGNPNGCTDQFGALLSTDQRGYARKVGSACDMGGFEYASKPPPTKTPTKTATPTKTNTPQPTKTKTPSPTNPPTACNNAPAAPTLLLPAFKAKLAKGKVTLDWNEPPCAKTYQVTIKKLVFKNGKKSKKIFETATVTTSGFTTTKVLKHGKYFWSVRACDNTGCTASKTFKFKIQ